MKCAGLRRTSCTPRSLGYRLSPQPLHAPPAQQQSSAHAQEKQSQAQFTQSHTAQQQSLLRVVWEGFAAANRLANPRTTREKNLIIVETPGKSDHCQRANAAHGQTVAEMHGKN